MTIQTLPTQCGVGVIVRVYALDHVATSGDFKAMVLESVNRSAAEGRSLRRGEVLLIGQAAFGGLIRLRIPRRYRLFDALMVRGFIKQKGLERLGILVADDLEEGQPRFLLALVNRDDALVQGGSADPNLVRLSRAATQEWLGIRPPMTTVLGLPWPIALMVVVLVLDLGLGLERMAFGKYSWLPMIPSLSAEVIYFVYLVLVAMTAVVLWRRMKFGYGLALTVAAVQLVRSIALTVESAQSATIDPWR